MKITLLWPGKTREAWLQQGISAYIKRLGHYYQLELVETRAGSIRGRRPNEVMEAEANLLIRAVPKGARVAVLDIKGHSMSSEALASLMRKEGDCGTRNLCFIIGGAYGLSDQVISMAQWRISLSPMTFTHEMARLILTEQLYRAATINAGEPYHH